MTNLRMTFFILGLYAGLEAVILARPAWFHCANPWAANMGRALGITMVLMALALTGILAELRWRRRPAP